MKTVKTRPYRSARRSGQAEETRQRILAAARRLFTTRGYGATTIEAIAEKAGVAAPTVYAGFGAKRGILLALLDQMARDADVDRLNAALADETADPRAQLRARVAFTTRFYSGGIDLIQIARTVSGVEPDLAAMWSEGEGRRYRSVSATVEGWGRAGALRRGLTVRKAIDVFWALGGPDVFRLLVVERKWSRRAFETWLTGALEEALLDGAA